VAITIDPHNDGAHQAPFVVSGIIAAAAQRRRGATRSRRSTIWRRTCLVTGR
jgi:hypothetical protein